MTVALLVVASLACLPGTASAHAQLVSSQPPAGAVLPSQPRSVVLSFGEPVEVEDNSVEVFDDRFARVDTGPASAAGADHDRIRVDLPAGLGRGTYTVSWHVSSADTHPASGTFRFSIGAPSVVRGTVPGVGRNDDAGRLLGLLRWTGYLGLVLGPGLLVVALALWPAGLAVRRIRRLSVLGLVLLGVATLGGMVLQGVWASGRPISALWSAPETLDSHSERFDQVYALRSYLVIAFGAVLVTALNTAPRAAARRRGWLLGAGLVSTLALCLTWPLVGHSSAGSFVPAAVLVNLVHTLAMTGWLGGLVLVLAGLGTQEQAEVVAVLPRFSRLAFTAVITLVVTGSYLAWREVGSLGALTGTTFGTVLMVKLAAVVALLALGNLARRWVQREVVAGSDDVVAEGDVRRFRLGVVAETVIAAGILALTSALVVIIPAAQAVAR